MNPLLLFFALPVATVILAIVFQKLLDNPILVGLTFFAIYIVLAFSVFSESFLIYAIIYTILAYVTAVITRFIKKIIDCQNNNSIANTSIIEEETNSICTNCNNNNNCNCMRDDFYNRKYMR